MKKGIVGALLFVFIIIVGVFAFTKYQVSEEEKTTTESKSKTDSVKKNDEVKPPENNEVSESKESQEDGYEIIISKKNITVEKGKETSFDITFTNPDESSVREYIHCDDQSDIVIVKYSPLENSKIKVDVEGLKEGTTEILISDYNYPDRKEIVKVTVIE